jgi:hypothetical protein
MANSVVFKIITWAQINKVMVEEMTEIQVAQALLEMTYFRQIMI